MIILSATASCEHKELCYDHFDHALKYSTRISATYDLAWELTEPGGPDWESDWPESFGFSYESMIRTAPAGLRVISTCEGGSGRMSSVNIAACGGEVGLAPDIILCCSTTTTRNISSSTISALSHRPKPLPAAAPAAHIPAILSIVAVTDGLGRRTPCRPLMCSGADT